MCVGCSHLTEPMVHGLFLREAPHFLETRPTEPKHIFEP